MGWLKERVTRDGKVRYTAVYLDIRGKEQSAGTFSNKKEANKSWQAAEAKVAEGRAGDPRRGRQTFERYVRETWLPNHVMELRTRENYTLYLERVIIPEFGPMRMREIVSTHVREWVTKFHKGNLELPQRQKGQRAKISNSPAVIEYCMVILSAIFTTALIDQVITVHPCKGVKTPAVPKKVRRIITPEQFDDVYAALPNNDMRLFVETDIESGLRYGELTELRVKDLDRATRVLTVSRVVVELTKQFQTDGNRFVVKGYPKDEEERQLRLSVQIVKKIDAHIRENGLQAEDLIFAIRSPEALHEPPLRVVPNPDELGLTEPNQKGRQYQHGTKTAYISAKCRCEYCRAAFSIYRAERRAVGKDQPRQRRTVTTDGHIPRSWFRQNVWLPARSAAGLDSTVQVKGLRSAHASWLLAGGADIQIVKERLGHGSILTTQKYLGSLPEADDAAVDAFSRIRRRSA
ncbi:tyrosine-type recombinase/integrase [Rhizomonospora bruguierae]|uniref:tyrosine-type recombinase/integrase n=1 Tax=Rhizomonospora bruguierae TaxID=1581705 RepID=UPI001BCE743A|nr:tyrosine-type recombinase/integrase [Micromonospora sp. NBRC 107566]